MITQKFELLSTMQKQTLKLASKTGFGYLLRYGLKRPEWIFRPQVPIPHLPLICTPGKPPTEADAALCNRLIAAYHRAQPKSSGDTESGSCWADIIEERHQRLMADLAQKNAQNLASTLSTMFQESFLYGITYGDLYKDTVRSQFWYLKFVDDLVSLGEYLGVVRMENPEQGVTGYALTEGLESLVKSIEAAADIKLDFPLVGAPYGFQIGSSFITQETLEHAYAALRVNRAISRYLSAENAAAPHIVEIGAGYGGAAYRMHTLRQANIGSYTIIDLPLINVLQGYFLGKVFGPDRVSLYGEPESEPKSEPTVQRAIRIRPTFCIDEIPDSSVDVLLNENSMPEMPEAVVEGYLRFARRSVRGLFYSYNQEAYSPIHGVPQVLVPEVVARIGGFTRYGRDLSWIRRGYVEEVYLSETLSKTTA